MPEKLEVMSAEIKLIRDPEIVLRLARKAVNRLPSNIKRLHTFNLYVPREIITGTSWEQYYATEGHLHLHVPVDQGLEKRAKDATKSPPDPHKR